MNYASIHTCDIANGPGVRTSLFVSGCRHACPGCFNQEAQAFDYGSPFDETVIHQIIDSCRPAYVHGITLLGGEPMEPENQGALIQLLQRFRKELPGKSVWCYTGCLWEELTGDRRSAYFTQETSTLLSLLDVLVDGPFVQALHDVSLRFRGSSNQRLIDVQKSLKTGSVVLWEDIQLYASHQMV